MENEISNAKQDMENERNKLKADFDTKLEQHNKEIDEKTKEFETKKKQLEEVFRRSPIISPHSSIYRRETYCQKIKNLL